MRSSKYDPLAKHLKSLNHKSIPMTFEDIEKIVGFRLPPSARKHRPWWSNNPSNSVITYAWLKAGYKTADVDMERHRLVFRKQEKSPDTPVNGDLEISTSSAPDQSKGMKEAVRMFDPNEKTTDKDVFAKLYGCMKGTVKIAPGVNLTAALFTDEDLAAFDAKWNRLLTSPKDEARDA